MDGYAVRSASFTSDGSRRRRLRVVARSFPGDAQRTPLDPGSAVEIFTGAMLPPGANAVVRSEDCRRVGRWVMLDRPVPAGRNVARRGEDFRPGRTIVRASVSVRPWHLAALVANEVSTIRVRARPRVGLLSTGSELEDPRASVRAGRTRDSAKPLLRSMLLELGAVPIDLGIAPDREPSIRRRLQEGLRTCDVVVTTGGTSVGTRDRVPAAVEGLRGARWIAHRLRLRPGSSTRIAIVARRPVFLLSGPPVAAFAGFVALVEPVLRDTWGASVRSPGTVPAILAERVVHRRGMREMVRVRLLRREGVPRATVVERHGAARLSSLTGADGLLVLDERRGDYRKGERVPVVPL
jgi:molybdenum cofactor synthesis domain-containing protein